MRRACALAAVVLAGLLPAAAQAGGWAVTSLSSLPDGLAAGDTWVVDLTVMQHGQTPLEGVQPAVMLKEPGGMERRFAAVPTGAPGVYRAKVRFRAAGTYTYGIDDGFTNAFPQRYSPVEVAASGRVASAPDRRAAAPPHADAGIPWQPFAIFALAAALVSAAVMGLRRPAGTRAPRAAA